MPTGSSRSAFAEFFRDLRLPEAMRAELARPLGPVLTGDALIEALRGAPEIIAVGDYCTWDLLSRGVDLRMAIVDRKTKRSRDDRVALVPQFLQLKVIPVTNREGTISRESWLALDQAFKSGERVRVQVVGEEDLLTLAVIALAPEGAGVVYGQPDEGAVVVRVDPDMKARVRDILSRMV